MIIRATYRIGTLGFMLLFALMLLISAPSKLAFLEDGLLSLLFTYASCLALPHWPVSKPIFCTDQAW